MIGSERWEMLPTVRDDDDLHLVANASPGDVVSLHVYARPIVSYSIYDARTCVSQVCASEYDSRVFV